MLVNGKEIAEIIELGIKQKLQWLEPKKVCFILFGDDPSSKQFIKVKSKVAERLGIFEKILEYSGDVTTKEAVQLVTEASKERYDGIVVQLPLPKSLDATAVLNSIPENLDIDLLSEESKKKYSSGASIKTPPVSKAVLEILKFYNITPSNKKVLVVGNGRLVGEPLKETLTLMGVTHSTVDIDTPKMETEKLMAEADIIISGVGLPNFIKPEMIKDGVVLIDAGTSEQSGKLVGDVDPKCAEKASLISPVPGGVGPVTVVSLYSNLF